MARFLSPVGGRSLFGRDPFLDLHREMNRLFDDTFRGMQGGERGAGTLAPSIDVNETDDGWEVTAEIPGVAEEDIDLRLDGDMLTISGEKRKERTDEQDRFVERSYGSFSRTIQLPFEPDADKVTADCNRGVLTVKLPRGAEHERSKRISVGGRQGSQPSLNPEQPAVGKDWSKEERASKSEGELDREQAQKGQGAPA